MGPGFDSTMCYPGEGPPRPVSIASANRTSSWSVVAAIKAGHFVDYDILLLQETHLPRGRDPQAQLQSKQLGYSMYAQPPSLKGMKSARGSGV